MAIRLSDPTIAHSVELPRVIRLAPNLFAAAFPLMKLCPARFILDRAADEGRIRPGSHIIETTSGTFGLALAMLAALRGYRLTLVSDPIIDAALRRRLEDLGATVEIVPRPAEPGGYQGARLARMRELQRAHPDHFWPSQYDNPHNAGGYASVAELLAETVGRVDSLVGTVGSGGSMCGTAEYLRVPFPAMRAVGVDTHGSVLFGHPDEPRLLRGLGNSLMPRNLDHTAFDEVHWVPAGDAFRATRALHRAHALYMGATSGAAFLVARWEAARDPDRVVVALLPDEGHRYQDTVYDDRWLAEHGIGPAPLPDEPAAAAHPSGAGPQWTRMEWARRTWDQVMGEAHARAA